MKTIWRWRIGMIGLIVASLAILVSAIWFKWEARSLLRLVRPDWQAQAPFAHRLSPLDQGYLQLSTLAALATLYLNGLLALLAFPRPIRRMVLACSNNLAELARLTLIGLATTLLLIVIGVSSLLTMGTFPLTFFAGSILVLGGFGGYIALAYALGHGLLLRAGWGHLSPLYGLFLGLLILFALGEIPWLGLALRAIFFSLGMGVVVATRFGSGEPWDLTPLREG